MIQLSNKESSYVILNIINSISILMLFSFLSIRWTFLMHKLCDLQVRYLFIRIGIKEGSYVLYRTWKSNSFVIFNAHKKDNFVLVSVLKCNMILQGLSSFEEKHIYYFLTCEMMFTRILIHVIKIIFWENSLIF